MRIIQGTLLFLVIAGMCVCISCFNDKEPKPPIDKTDPEPVGMADPVEEPPDGEFNMADVTPGGLNWSASGVRVEGHFAWVMGEFTGIQIFDISDPAHPAWVKKLDIRPAGDIVFVDGYAYITTGSWDNSKFVVVDCDPVESAEEIGSLPLPGTPGSLYLSGSTVCLPLSNVGLAVIDVGRPESPRMAKFFANEHLWGTTDVEDGYAYAIEYDVDNFKGLTIYDIDPPDSAQAVKSVALDVTGSSDVAVSGGFAYVSDYTNGIYVVDVDPPQAAHLETKVGLARGTRAIKIAGDCLYSANNDGSFQAIDISVPGSATAIGTCRVPPDSNKLLVDGQYVYVRANPSRLQLVDISNPLSPASIGGVDLPEYLSDFVVKDGYVYVADSDTNLHIIDARHARSPRIVYSSDSLKGTNDVDVVGQYAYVIEGQSLKILDITAPESPIIAATVDTGLPASRVIVSGGYAWITFIPSYSVPPPEPGLVLIDVDPVSSAHVVTNFKELGQVNDLMIEGNHAYLAADLDGFRILDISSPESPRLIRTIPSSAFFSGAYHRGAAVSVGVSNGNAVVGLQDTAISEWFGSLGIVDIDPAGRARVVGTVGINDAKRIRIKDGYAYAACGMFGFLVFDIDPPDQLQLVSSLNRPPSAGEIVLADMAIGPPPNGVSALCLDIAGKYAYVADGGSFHVFDLSNAPTLSDVTTADFAGGATGLDVSGRYAYLAGGWAGLRVVRLW